MAEGDATLRDKLTSGKPASLHFDVSTGLKRVLGRELITNSEVAIFEMVKNSFDAGADTVHLHFEKDNIIVADNGCGMSYNELQDKWLFVAFSAKRAENAIEDFRNRAAERGHYGGSKGVGRFSSDRLGEELILQTRPKDTRSKAVHKLTIDWSRFEENDKRHFESVPVEYNATEGFDLPDSLHEFGNSLSHGTIIKIGKLRQEWRRAELVALKASLAKLINPFGADADSFNIFVDVPDELAADQAARSAAKKANEELPSRDIVNGRVGNFIFSDLQKKTTFIQVAIEGDKINTSLTDRGELIYKICEPNPYKGLNGSDFRCEIYYLNQSAKATFTRRVGLQSVNFGSVFLFRNGFRVYPIGEVSDDWFGFDRRKQQGYSRFLGTREIIGRVDVSGSDKDFQEASSRNQGLIETPAVRQLHKAVMEHCLKRLEKYVVPVSWADNAESKTEDLSRLLTDPGRARVSAAVANLVDNKEIELLDYSKRLITLLNERSTEFESSLVNLKAIAEKTGDIALLARLQTAEKRFDELRKSEADARKIADRERAVAIAAVSRADTAEAAVEHERRRSSFLQSVVNVDTSTILNLHHQVTIYAVDIGQQIENFLIDTADQKVVSRELLLGALEQIAFLNRKVLAITRFAAKANFKLDSEKIETDIAGFVTDYIENIARASATARMRINVSNEHPGMKLRFNPIDVSIIVDNMISNAKRAKASYIRFDIDPLEKSGLSIRITDNGNGLARGVDSDRIFEMGYTTTKGSGLGLYHVRQVVGDLGGTVELAEGDTGQGVSFLIKLYGTKKQK